MIDLRFEPGYRELLADARLGDFDAFMRVEGAFVASRHATRETIALELPVAGAMKRFYLKRVFRVPPRHALAPWLRGRRGKSQPRREWDMLEQLRLAGLPAMQRVAMGEQRVAGIPRQAFLMVEAAPWAHTLEEWLVPGFPRPGALTDVRRNALWREIGALVRRLTESGFAWPDLHAKHIFASPEASNTTGYPWRFCLIDVERMRPRVDRTAMERDVLSGLRRFVHSLRPLTLREAEVDAMLLGAFGAGVGDETTRSCRHAWFAEPLREGPRLPDDYEHPRAAREVVREGVTIRTDAQAMLSRAGLDHLVGVFQNDLGERLSKPALATHRERIRVSLKDDTGQTRTVYLKRYRGDTSAALLKLARRRADHRSPALREARFIRKLNSLGIATARILAFGESLHARTPRLSFLLLEGLPGESLESLTLRCRRDPTKTPPWRERIEIIRQLARLARQMHANRLFHRDFYLCHVFLTRNTDGGIVLRVIDLARMIHRPWRTRRWRIKDMAALASSAPRPLVTRADRLRFLREYYGGSKLPREYRREWAAIASRAERTLARDARRATAIRREGTD